MFVTSLWIGGYVGNELRTAGARYGSFEFWPGPLDVRGRPPADCSLYDRIYRVNRTDITTYNQTGSTTPDLAEWPAHLGAPVLDGDGIQDNYDLQAGDRPALMGDQMAWWVMNDRGNVHESTGSVPIGLEVHVTAFAYDVEGTIGNTTFYRYKLIYKGNVPFEDAYVGFYVDPDLGNFDDDYVGVDTTLDLAYVYNADNHDEFGYEENPPSLGYLLLDGPRMIDDAIDNDWDGVVDEADERLGMTSFVCIQKGTGSIRGEPTTADGYYNILKGLLKDGTPIPFASPRSLVKTKFCYPGEPESGGFWSAFNTDGAGTAEIPSDKRFSFSSGPFVMHPGNTQTISFALVGSQGADHLDAIRQLRKNATYVRSVAKDLYAVSPLLLNAPKQPQALPPPLTFTANYPNPFTDETTIRYSLPIAASVHLAIYDALGQEVAVLVNGEQSPDTYTAMFAAETLPPGVYFYRLVLDGHYTFTKAMLRVR